MDPFKAAIGAAYLSLVPLTFITFPPSAASTDVEPAQTSTPVKFGAATDRWGTEFVKPSEVTGWEQKKGEAATLLVKCEDLYQSFRTAEVTTDHDTVTEHM
jgi:3-keto steroid reductase